MLRKELKSLRNKLSGEEVAEKSAAICKHILESEHYRSANVIFAYLAFGKEVNIDMVINDALQNNKIVAVPKIIGPHEMIAVSVESLDDIQIGDYSIRTAKDDAKVIDPATVDLVLVPGVGFDMHGHRMGMGAGFYDRFLPKTGDATLIGVTYDCLLAEAIPYDRYDVSVDCLVTETNKVIGLK